MELETLRPVIVSAFPELANSRFTLMTSGWDSMAVDVDERLIFKFPRDKAAEEGLRTEAKLLAFVCPYVTLPIPKMQLHPGPPIFSSHTKIKGEHLLTKEYELLPKIDQHRLAADLALFYAQLHDIDVREIEAVGAQTLKEWMAGDEMLRRARRMLPAHLHDYAERTVEAWQNLPPDPYGTIYGFFDGHGWNMAFDHQKNQLNGIYDFADSGLGTRHQEFIYSNWISPDLTERIIGEYELLLGLVIDRERVELLTAVNRLREVAEAEPHEEDLAVQGVISWAAHQRAK